MCCRERELCGFVHGEDFIITGDSMQSAWRESRLNEGLILKRRAILGTDDLGFVFLDPETGLRLKPTLAIERSSCADESGRCEREVSDDSSGEDTRVDAQMLTKPGPNVDIQECDDESKLHVHHPR